MFAFEELSVNGEFCAEHKDKDDENQTVTFPDIQTTARDNVTEDHVSNATDSITIVDTVAYTGLKKGDTYTVTGTLMDAETGEAALDDDGNAITASKEFTTPSTDGNIDITFTFAGVSLAGKTLVAFEDIPMREEDMPFMRISMIRIRLFTFQRSTPRLWMQIPD